MNLCVAAGATGAEYVFVLDMLVPAIFAVTVPPGINGTKMEEAALSGAAARLDRPSKTSVDDQVTPIDAVMF
jgi:hypothetical protein